MLAVPCGDDRSQPMRACKDFDRLTVAFLQNLRYRTVGFASVEPGWTAGVGMGAVSWRGWPGRGCWGRRVRAERWPRAPGQGSGMPSGPISWIGEREALR